MGDGACGEVPSATHRNVHDPATIATALETMPHQTFRVERLNALTDGVFAIALTLLVLELKLPNAGEGTAFLEALRQDWHVFFAWLISFVAIARFWIVHHSVVAQLERCHTGT
ncbi:MAG: TMEM175 family protein, partial [Ornithinimicrobium sp.]